MNWCLMSLIISVNRETIFFWWYSFTKPMVYFPGSKTYTALGWKWRWSILQHHQVIWKLVPNLQVLLYLCGFCPFAGFETKYISPVEYKVYASVKMVIYYLHSVYMFFTMTYFILIYQSCPSILSSSFV